MHGRQETVDAVAVFGEAQLRQAADYLFLQFVLRGDFSLQKQVAVLIEQRRQLITAEGAAVQHRERIATLIR